MKANFSQTTSMLSTAVFLVLTGCGGGDESTSPPPSSQSSARPALVSWTGSISGPWVYTANNGVIAFTRDDGVLYDYDTGHLNGVVKIQGAKIYVGGVHLANVVLKKNINNQDVAAAICLNGQLANKVPLGNSSSLVCSSGTNPPPSGGGTNPPPSGGGGSGNPPNSPNKWVPQAQRASCVDIKSTSTGGRRWYNKCAEIVEVTFCISYSDGSKSGCNSTYVLDGVTVYNTAGLFQIPANGNLPYVYGKSGLRDEVFFGACKHEFIPKLMSGGKYNCHNFYNKPVINVVSDESGVSDGFTGVGILVGE